jgi:drug/metabolite transporter (DMT)-like permease
MELKQELNPIVTTTLAFTALGIAILSLSMAGLFIRLSEQEVGPIGTAFHRLWIATLTFGFLNIASTYRTNKNADITQDQEENQVSYSRKRIGLLLGAAVTASISLLLWNWSLANTNIANATLMRNANVLFTPVLGWLLFRQTYDRKFLVGMVVAIIGIITIGFQDVQIAQSHLNGDLAALLSAFAVSTFLIIVEQLRSHFTTLTILLWRCFIGTFLILPIFLLFEDNWLPYTVVGWLAIAAQAVICQGLGQGLLIYSLKRLSAGFVALVVPLEVFFASILAWLVFSETVSLVHCLGFAIVFIGVFLAKSSQSSIKAVK